MAISLGQLDLEALEYYLKIVCGFRTVNDPSGDTENVGGVSAELIATVSDIISGNEKFLEQSTRSIVDNALGLVQIKDGELHYISSDDVLTAEEGTELQENAVKAAQNTANDMRSLRNEMYHLKRDMVKSGALEYDPVYDGFIDPFLNGNILYTEDPLIVDSMEIDSVNIEDGNIYGYDINQYVAFLKDDSFVDINFISEKSGSSLGFPSRVQSADVLTKSYGLYKNGQFIFGNEGTTLQSVKDEVNMIYKDGTSRIKIAELNGDVGIVGFASTIVVPAELHENFLSGINVSLRRDGVPGTCYLELYDYNEENIYGSLIATSNFLNSGKVTNEWNTYKFTFDNEVLLNQGHIYLLVIKANATNKNNYWSLGGFAEQCNNNIHQDTYLFTNGGKYQKESVDILTNQIYDMFIGLCTTKTKKLSLQYSNKGLYTGSFDLENTTATRVRVSFNPRNEGNIDFYKVYVKGQNSLKNMIFAKPINDIPYKYNHFIKENGETSASEVVYDFAFDEEVSFVEFQIVFDCTSSLDESTYESLFAVVVSTDNAYLKGVEN